MATLLLFAIRATLCGEFCLPIAGIADGGLVQRFADSAGVPLTIALAVAAVESGYAGGNAWRGSAGEVGRMQVTPRLWERSFSRECGPGPLTDYVTNVCKGMFILRYWHQRTGSWEAAVRRYNGRGPEGRVYVHRVRRIARTLAQRGIKDAPAEEFLGRSRAIAGPGRAPR